VCYDSSMKIKIRYFASLREQIGRAGDELECKDSISVLGAWQQATGLSELSDNLLIAVNQEYTSEETLLEEGDELAFFPPVTGG